jgi:hypothetical protein
VRPARLQRRLWSLAVLLVLVGVGVGLSARADALMYDGPSIGDAAGIGVAL